MDVRDFLRLLVRRSWLVLLLTALAAGSAYMAVRGDPKVYERTVSFVLGPSSTVEPARVPDAIRSLEEDGAMVQTIRGLLGSALFLELAAREARREVGPDYEMRGSIRPGSNILDVRINGPDPDVLTDLGEELPAVAADWVDDNYRVYELTFLETEAPEGPVLPRIIQTTAFAAVVGFMLAIGAVVAEGIARTPRREESWLDEAPQPARSRVAAADERRARARRDDGHAERRAGGRPSEIHIAEIGDPAAAAAAPRHARASARGRKRGSGPVEPPRADA